MFLKDEFSNRLVQISLFAGIVYYITAYPIVFEKARKYFPIKFKKTHHLLIFHTFVFMVLMYVLTYFVFDPLVRVVEGADSISRRVGSGKSSSDPRILNQGDMFNCEDNVSGIGTPTGNCGEEIFFRCSSGVIKQGIAGAYICE